MTLCRLTQELRRTMESIEDTISGELDLLPAVRRHALTSYLVTPFKQCREHGYKPVKVDCWVIAEGEKISICYYENGLGSFCRWGILEKSTSDLGRDDAWHISLDHAFINSGLCDRKLVPNNYEVP